MTSHFRKIIGTSNVSKNLVLNQKVNVKQYINEIIRTHNALDFKLRCDV